MALRAISLDEIEDYVLIQERVFATAAGGESRGKPTDFDKVGRPIEGATVWKLKTLSARTLASIKAKAVKMIGSEGDDGNQQMAIHPNMSELNYETTRAALNGVTNFEGTNGRQVVSFTSTKYNIGPNKVEGASSSFMDYLKLEWIDEMGTHIWETHEVTAEEGEDSGA